MSDNRHSVKQRIRGESGPGEQPAKPTVYPAKLLIRTERLSEGEASIAAANHATPRPEFMLSVDQTGQ
jgi:hypothetical protein